MSFTLPNGLVPFGPQANCTLDTCPLEASVLQYRPSPVASWLFISIFTSTLIVHVVQGWLLRSWGFAASMVCGCILNIVGYAGRIQLYSNPFDYSGFIMQIVCITIAPIFYCSAIYVLLSQIIIRVDPTISRLRPKLLYAVFIPCDIVSLILQAVGGALSSMSGSKEDSQVGVNISLSGLVFQVATLVVFCLICVDYFMACRRTSIWNRFEIRYGFYFGFISLATLLILLRCIYRVVELHEGYFSEWFRDEGLFIALESSVIFAAVLCLNIGHPGYAFRLMEKHSRPSAKPQVGNALDSAGEKSTQPQS